MEGPLISCSPYYYNLLICQLQTIHPDNLNGILYDYEVLVYPVRFISEDQMKLDVNKWDLKKYVHWKNVNLVIFI